MQTLAALLTRFTGGATSTTSTTADGEPPVMFVDTFSDARLDVNGNKVLYLANQELTCRVMLSAASFNLFYWSYYLTNCWYYQDVVVQGVHLGGDFRWGVFGAFGTGLMYWVTQQYAHHAVSKCYESPDGLRLGFQMHTMLGRPGRKVECSVGNAYILDRAKKQAASAFGSSYVPLRVKGIDKNILIDRTGSFFVPKGGEEQERPLPLLMQLLQRGEESRAQSTDVRQAASDKEGRIQWLKDNKGVAKKRAGGHRKRG